MRQIQGVEHRQQLVHEVTGSPCHLIGVGAGYSLLVVLEVGLEALKRFAKVIALALEIAALIGGPSEYIAPRLEPHDTLADNRKAKELLGWTPQVSLEEGIAQLKKEFGIA